MGIESVTQSQQFLPKRGVVVDFAVEHNPDGAVLIVDGLVPAAEVYDAKAPHAQANTRLDHEALVVRPTMAHRVAHPAQHIFTYFTIGPERCQATYSTHRNSVRDQCLRNRKDAKTQRK